MTGNVSLLAFIAAGFAIAIVPGPTVTLLVANSMKYGTRAGLANLLGTQVGVLIWLAMACFGLASVLTLLGPWFIALRLAGAAYLIWLGLKLFRSHGDFSMGGARAKPASGFFLQGLYVIMSNPKMLVLFGALIPPFIPAGANVTWETFKLGLMFEAMALVTDGAYTLLAGRAGALLSKTRLRVIEVASGTCLIGGALWMAWQAVLG